MATRVYLQNASAGISPSNWATGWGTPVTGNVTKNASLIKGSTAFATVAAASGSAVATLPFMRFLLGPLPAQTISGTLKAQMRGSESNAASQNTHAIGVRLLKSDGTERSVLVSPTYADVVDNAAYELYTSLRNLTFYDTSESASISLTSQSATAGDYLEITIGSRKNSAVTSRTITLEYGDNSSGDLPEDQSTTSQYCPWVEFSGTVSVNYTLAGSTIPSGEDTINYGVQQLNFTLSGAGNLSSGIALYAPTVSGSVASQSLTGAFLDTTASLYAPSGVSPGPVTLTGGTVGSGSTAYAPTVAPGAVALTGATIGSGSTLSAPTAAYRVTAAYMAAASVLFAASLTVGPVALTGSTVGSTSALYEPTVTPAGGVAQNLTGSTVAAGSAVYAPSAAPGPIALTGATVPAGSATYAPTATPGAVSVTAPTVGAGSALYAPTNVAVGPATLYPPAIGTTSSVTSPGVSPGPVALTGGVVASGSSLAAPTLRYAVAAPTIAAGSAAYAPTVVPSPSSLTLPTLASGVSLFPGYVTQGDLPSSIGIESESLSAVIASSERLSSLVVESEPVAALSALGPALSAIAVSSPAVSTVEVESDMSLKQVPRNSTAWYTAVVTQPSGQPLSGSSLTGAFLTLTNVRTGKIINGRDGVASLLGTLITVDSSGNLSLELTPADNACTTKQNPEVHRADIRLEWPTSRAHHHFVDIEVENP